MNSYFYFLIKYTKKINKLKQLINSRGFSLRKPLHWIKLIRIGCRFISKHGVNTLAALKDSFYIMKFDDVDTALSRVFVTQTHAQIWERIKPTHAEFTKLRWAIPNFKKKYKFSVIIKNEDLNTISSIVKQIYDKFEIIIGDIDECSKASCDYILFLQPGDFLHRNALFELNFELNRINKTPPFIYFDHDYFLKGIVDNPFYKPDWSHEVFSTYDYIDRACVFKYDLLMSIKFEKKLINKSLSDIILKLSEFGSGHHIPGILLTMSNIDIKCVNSKILGVYNNPYLVFEETVSVENQSPVICRHVGSPSISTSGINKIIIVKLDHIGDVVASIPAIRNIRRMLPNAIIDVLCGPWTKELFEQQPEITNVFTYSFFNIQSGVDRADERELYRDKIIKQMLNNKYDLAINLRKHPDTKDISSLIADYCLVLSDNAERDYVSHPVPAIGRIAGDVVKWNITDQLLSLTDVLSHDDILFKDINVLPEICDKVDKSVKDIPFFKCDVIIGMHVGSGYPNKQWPVDNFISLCNIIHANTSANIVLLGSKNEKILNQKIIDSVKNKDKIMSVAGMFSLVEFFHLIKKMDYFIGNDSGPGHIAGIQGVSTLVIMGSRHPSTEWIPIGKSMVVECCTPCGPCYDNKLDCVDCLFCIKPTDVYFGLERLIILYPSKRRINV